MDSMGRVGILENIYTVSLNGCYGVLIQTLNENICYHISPMNKQLINELIAFCSNNKLQKVLQFYSANLQPINIASKKVAYKPININSLNINKLSPNFIGIENKKFIYKNLNI